MAIVTPISLPNGSREGVTMAATLLFLEGGWGVIIVAIPLPEGSRERVTVASTLLFLEGEGVWP